MRNDKLLVDREHLLMALANVDFILIRATNTEGTLDAGYVLWQYGLWSFQTGGTKLERFLPKNQHTQRKLLNLENLVNVEVPKSAKI